MLTRSLFRSLLHALNFSALLAFASAALAAAEPALGPHEIIPFDTDWRFWLGDNPAARQPGFDDSSWRTLDVPHDWSIEAAVNKPPEGEHNGGFPAGAAVPVILTLPVEKPPASTSAPHIGARIPC
jgi:hypothetical protein